MSASRIALIVGWAALSAAHPATANDVDHCKSRLKPEKVQSVVRYVTAEDLIGLRDLGPNWINDPRTEILALSPNGQKVAFQIIRADARTNGYCFGLMVQDVGPDTTPELIDVGGDYAMDRGPQWGFTEDPQPSGVLPDRVPKWSPDGKSLAFIRRTAGTNQLFVLELGHTSAQVTHGALDVEAFDWRPDGKTLTISRRPDLPRLQAQIELEGTQGYLFDDRFMPTVANRPFPRDVALQSYYLVTLEGQETLLSSDNQGAVSEDSRVSIEIQSPADQNRKAKLVSDSLNDRRLAIAASGQVTTKCTDLRCDHIDRYWWRSDGAGIYFLRREGARSGTTAIYEWLPTGQRIRKVLQTQDLLLSCELSNKGLLCLREGAITPRRLVLINLATGTQKVLFDPNPEFAGVRLGNVTRLVWKNPYGLDSYGDLVLPPGHRPGERHPLVVVQYHSRGFLRGGTGDDYPIQVLAARGMAVLSFQMPLPLAYAKGERNFDIVNRVGIKDWTDRRSILSALEIGLDKAIGTGAIDPDRIGLSGLSDGASTVNFAMINSRFHFKAAAISNCCVSPTGLVMLGEAGERFFRDIGYPAPSETNPEFWQPISLSLNAASMTTPLLMQLPDDEYLSALGDYNVLKARGHPTELYVYPNETHIKWQPAHRLASYNRSVDWFAFWLLGMKDPDPSKKKPQYERWRGLQSAATVKSNAK